MKATNVPITVTNVSVRNAKVKAEEWFDHLRDALATHGFMHDEHGNARSI
jgi:hypothetical protein